MIFDGVILLFELYRLSDPKDGRGWAFYHSLACVFWILMAIHDAVKGNVWI